MARLGKVGVLLAITTLAIGTMYGSTPSTSKASVPAVSNAPGPVTVPRLQSEGWTTRRPALTDLKFAQSHKYNTCRIQCNNQNAKCKEGGNSYEYCKERYDRCLRGC